MITILGKHSQLLDSYILKLGSTWCSIKWLFLVYLNWEWVYEKSLQPHLYKIYLSVGGYVLCCLLCLMLSQRKTQIYNNITLRYASLKEVSISGSNYAFLPVNWSSNGPGRQFPKQNLVWLSWDLPLLICTIATKLLLQRANLLLHHSVVKVFHFSSTELEKPSPSWISYSSSESRYYWENMREDYV